MGPTCGELSTGFRVKPGMTGIVKKPRNYYTSGEGRF